MEIKSNKRAQGSQTNNCTEEGEVGHNIVSVSKQSRRVLVYGTGLRNKTISEFLSFARSKIKKSIKTKNTTLTSPPKNRKKRKKWKESGAGGG